VSASQARARPLRYQRTPLAQDRGEPCDSNEAVPWTGDPCPLCGAVGTGTGSAGSDVVVAPASLPFMAGATIGYAGTWIARKAWCWLAGAGCRCTRNVQHGGPPVRRPLLRLKAATWAGSMLERMASLTAHPARTLRGPRWPRIAPRS
jgi:hypothetical protein